MTKYINAEERSKNGKNDRTSYDYYNITVHGALSNSNWKLENVLERTFEFGPVLDYRWELLPFDTRCKHELPINATFKLYASVQGTNNIHFCKKAPRSTCITILLEYAGPFIQSDNMQIRCDNYKKTPQEKYWRHFTLHANYDNITITQYGFSKFLKLPKTYNPEILVIDSKWKLHLFYVYSTGKQGTSQLQIPNDFSENDDVCVGLLCYVLYGTLRLELLDRDNNALSSVNNTKEDEWEEIILCGHIPFGTYMTLKIDTMVVNRQSKFYIADIIRKFSKNGDIRMLKMKHDPQDNQCCQNIKLSEKVCSENLTDVKTSTGKSNCSFASIGRNCFSCAKIFNQTYCPKQPICEFVFSSKETICSCPSGYTDINCRSSCAKGWYGFGCNNTCASHCVNSCDHITGICNTKTISAPGAVRNLTIYSVSNTSVVLRWLDPDSNKLLTTYYVNYTPIDLSTPLSREITAGRSHCKIWSNHICTEIDELNSAHQYTFTVYAKNNNATENGPSTDITAVIKNTAPAPPENVIYSWNDNSTILYLKWSHPYVEKSRITQFLIYLSNQYIDTYNVTQEQLEYEYEVEYSRLNITASQDVSLYISSCGTAGNNTIAANISTPPLTPRFLNDVNMFNITSSLINIQIPEVLDINGENSKLYVILTDMQNSMTPSSLPVDDQILEKAEVDTSLHSWIEFQHSLKDNFSKEISIGNIHKNHLGAGNTYRVSLLALNEYKNISRYSKITLDVTMLSDCTNNLCITWLYVAIPIIGIIIIVIVIFLFCRYRRRKNKENSNETFDLEHTYEELDLAPEIVDHSKVPDIQHNKYSNRITLKDLENYVKTSLENQEFDKQYEMMPIGQTHNWKCGIEPENRSKNRYKNVAAYDHTRVKLKSPDSDTVSDYINANYIDGYGVSKAYIATQGPKTNTINDFWEMVWQENVEHIIMIANITEGGKKKVEQYWPNITETDIYGNYKVTFAEILVFAEYESKTFKIKYKDEERTVYHLHFTCWPDHGVPFYAQSLAPFLKRTIAIPYGKAPIVVHCSAGIGRTGTFILCDLCLRMAAKTGEVDVSYNLYKLREQRINMVDNINQYKLVHLALLHCLIVPDYTIQCTEFMEEEVNISLAYKIHNQMKYIEDSFWQDEAMRSVSTKIDDPIIKEKNRFENILPDEFARIALIPYPVSDASSKYINAIKVDGFCAPFRFVVTQYPLSNTIGDFWRLVDQYEISVIICLNDLDLDDETCCNFYPKLEELVQPTPYLEMKCIQVAKETYYNIYTINIQNLEKAQQRIIKIVHLKKWKYSEQHPEAAAALLMTYEQMNYLGKTSETILVACLDGTRASGLFTALCCLLDKIKIEQICDVCLAVRTVRHSRGEFVRRPEQFAFLYKCALEYVQQFEMYSNFSSNKKP